MTEITEHLDFNPETGVFTWKTSRSNVKAGAIAGTINHGYVMLCINDKRYLAHRLAWLYAHGEYPDGEIDHIDGNKANNRISNLRVVTHAENGKNVRLHKRNTSGLHGVSWDKRDKRWNTYINSNGKRTGLGLFVEFWDAVCARKSAEVENNYHANHGH